MPADLPQATWRKSSSSAGNGQCVELAHTDEVAGVRDSKDPGGPVLVFGVAELARFFGAVKAGRLGG